MRQLLFTLLPFFFLTAKTTAQEISVDLYQNLPDTVKPKNRKAVTPREASRIIYFFRVHGTGNPAVANETDSLCRKVAALQPQKNDTILTRFLLTACLFYEGHEDTTGVRLMIAKAENCIDQFTDKYLRTQAIIRLSPHKAYLLNRGQQYYQAYEQLKKAQQLAKETDYKEGYLEVTQRIAFILMENELLERALHYIDTLINYQARYFPEMKYQAGLYQVVRGNIYEGLYQTKGNPYLYDSVVAITDRVLADTAYPAPLTVTAQTARSMAEYAHGNFPLALKFADAALNDPLRNNGIAEWVIVATIKKGLSLIRLGKSEEGLGLINNLNLDSNNNYYPEVGRSLYLYYKEKKDYKNAVKYFDAAEEFLRMAEERKNKELAFSIEENYAIKSEKAQIATLEAKASRDWWLFSSALFVTLLTAGFLLERNIRNRKALRKAVEQVEILTENEIANINRAEYAQLEERRKIAEEMHSDFASSIAIAANFLRAKQLEAGNPEEQQLYGNISNLLQESYERARAKSHDLYQVQTDSFFRNLDQLFDLLFQGSGIHIEKTIDTTEFNEVPAEVKITLLMFMKEAAINIIKHARANMVRILLFRDGSDILATIEDDGKGLEIIGKQGGIGLTSIRERIQKLGGDMTIQSQKGKGTTLSIAIPVSLAA